MLHGDTKRLPLLVGQTTTDRREYLFVAIDDYSRELFAVILPDKMQTSSARFMEQVVDECAYTIEVCYTDNGTEYKGDPRQNAFMETCAAHDIAQGFTRSRRPGQAGKANALFGSAWTGIPHTGSNSPLTGQMN